MNRLELSDLPPGTNPATTGAATISTQLAKGGPPHALFSPLHYEKNYAYPLLIWLHGNQGNEHQLRQVMPLISMRNYVGVSTRGIVANATQEGSFRWEQTTRDISLAEHRILDCIEMAQKEFHLNTQRIYLAGFQSGGTMALRMALTHPERFAGVASIGGPFPQNDSPLRCLKEARNLPIFLAQSQFSTQYPVETACQELRLFHIAGLQANIRQYPCGDELDTQMLTDLDAWLMEQVTGVAPEDALSPVRWSQGEEN